MSKIKSISEKDLNKIIGHLDMAIKNAKLNLNEETKSLPDWSFDSLKATIEISILNLKEL